MVVVRAKKTVKPLSQRPLDLTYYAFFLVHLVCTVCIDLLPLYPAFVQTTPGLGTVYRLLKDVVDGYTAQTNDPFMLATWGLVERPWEFSHLKMFMWMEVCIQMPTFVIGMIGLRKDTSAIYPLLLAYASAALVTTITVTHGTLIAPSSADTSLDTLSKFYAMSDLGRWIILGPLIPFLIVPAIMWVDMMMRLSRLVKLGAQVEATKEVNGKGRKEL
ncbi:hypothetical protein M408DRAFT_332925 [Serendipita vermifera MAFF 305830]|uniref:EXPERA domain-containing protein n=1 Tax=Serendipita vermifera MAFF 305830 TaxID=933852 RepID=A0A0C2W7I0_SERVB|nr:hypothetical protein M408DRAFT_332925 [Serendipita vermifera MAFF 305830]